MNKKLIVFLLILLVGGCRKETSFEDVQQYYRELEMWSGVYKYEVDFGGVYQFVCQYDYDKGAGRLTVISPDEIAGITAVSDSTGEYLEFEDISVRTYLPESKEASPASALHILASDIRTKKPVLITETEVITLTYESGEYTKLAVISKEDYALLSCEIFYNGDRILNITLQ